MIGSLPLGPKNQTDNAATYAQRDESFSSCYVCVNWHFERASSM